MSRTPLLNIGELITDPDFCQDLQVIRRTGVWSNGRFITKDETIDTYGIIDPQVTEEMQFNPDGVLIRGLIKVYTHMNLYTTRKAATQTSDGYISDIVKWQESNYIVLSEDNYLDYGYRAYTCQLEEASGVAS